MLIEIDSDEGQEKKLMRVSVTRIDGAHDPAVVINCQVGTVTEQTTHTRDERKQLVITKALEFTAQESTHSIGMTREDFLKFFEKNGGDFSFQQLIAACYPIK